MVDLQTQAWLDDMFIYGGGNVYGPPQLKKEIDARGEWAKRFRSNFDHVLAEKKLTALEYEKRTEISFDGDVEISYRPIFNAVTLIGSMISEVRQNDRLFLSNKLSAVRVYLS